MSLRLQRLRQLMKEQVSDIIQSRMRDPDLGFVTVTDVEISADLRRAKVFVSVYGSEAEQKASFNALQRAAGFVRSELGGRLDLRFTPEIVFEYDSGVARGARIFELLADLETSEQSPEGAASGEDKEEREDSNLGE